MLLGACFLSAVVGSCIWVTDCDSEQLALTEQLFDAALGELVVIARGQPCLIVGDANVKPTKIPLLLEGITAGGVR